MSKHTVAVFFPFLELVAELILKKWSRLPSSIAKLDPVEQNKPKKQKI
jgi:hypothetical protein